VEHYASKLGLIFAPLFFAIIGAQVDFRGIGANPEILIIGAIVIGIAVATKMLGCGLPAWLFLRNGPQAKRVGIGMVSRGEVGLIVAGVGLSSGVLTSNVYTTIVLMVAATSIITPIWLKMEYRKELQKNPEPQN
jgi:Kef-type K+ transport system membrane component KefB